jgi:hypothetical protein
MKVKILNLAIALIAGSNAFAGGRYLYCEGAVIKMNTSAKGPRPDRKDIIINGIENNIRAREVFFIEDNDSYDFQIVYQSQDPGINVVALLKYIDGNHILSVTRNADTIEEDIPCTLGF